ncbi:MAG: ABC transporter substrate-binding protein [Bifidobacteriaceae bacterium]|jgi:peptide/nickel transport system substrate-binding protein|nr:ABC transporter substrate-binding protein [Bifidobacteriaceae bacterium]
MKSLKTGILSLLVAAPLALAGCGNDGADGGGGGASEDASTGAKTGAFTYVISSDPTSLNPINTGDRWGLTFANIVYQPLARIDGATGEQELDLAESIEASEDGLAVTVKLKPDLKFSDGEALTAADVVFTYNIKAVKDNGNADLLWVRDKPITATAVDDLTVRFDLPYYSAAALSNIATETFILPEHIYGAETDFSGSELAEYIGSGPYTLTEYKRGEYLEFAANPLYSGGQPSIEKLVLRIVSNADTVKAALQTGEVDASYVVPAQLADLEGSPVGIYPYPEGRVAYLGVVTPKVDLKLRQALFFSLDRTQIAKAAWLEEKNYQYAYSILPPSNPYATTDLEKYDIDVDKAKALVAESGVADPTLKLGYDGSDPQQQAEAAVIQSEAQAAGITVELVSLDGGTVFDEIEKGVDSAVDLFLGGYIMGIDPDAYSLLFRTDASANYFSYSNPAVDKLFDDGVAAADQSARKAVYAELQAKIADDAVFFAIADNLKIIAINDRIGGIDQAKLVSIYTFEKFGSLTEK